MALENRKLTSISNKLNRQDISDYDDDDRDQYIRDTQNSNDNNTFKNFLIAGLAVAGGYGLYKSGLAKNVIKEGLELGDTIAENWSNKGYYNGHAIRKWALAQDGIIRPEMSIFNPDKIQSLGYDIVADIKESFNRKTLYTTNIRKALKDTISDIRILNRTIQEESNGYSEIALQDIADKIKSEMDGQPEALINQRIKQEQDKYIAEAKLLLKRKTHSMQDTSLIKNIRDINNTSGIIRHNINTASENSDSIINKTSEVMMSDFYEKMNLTAEQAQDSLRRTGYRPVTLGDIFDTKVGEFKYKRDASGKFILDSEGNKIYEDTVSNILSKIDLKSSYNANSQPFGEMINKFFNKKGQQVGINGKRININDREFWKNIIIDDSLAIDESGNVINYMMSRKALEGTINSLRQDFGLPVLKFNPLNVALRMSNIDNFLHDRQVQYAFIKGTRNYNPIITGHGTRNGDDVNETIQKMLNNYSEDFNVLASKGKLYVVGTEGTFKHLDVGGRVRVYEIPNAQKSYQMPWSIEAMRRMGNFNLYEDQYGEINQKNFLDMLREAFGYERINNGPFNPISNEKSIAEYEKHIGRKLTPFEKTKYTIGRMFDVGAQEYVEPDDAMLEFGDVSNIDTFFDEMMSRINNSEFLKTNGFEFNSYKKELMKFRDKTYAQAFGETFDPYMEHNVVHKAHQYAIIRDGYTIKDFIQDTDFSDSKSFMNNLQKMVGQYFVGFDKNYKINPYYTEKSTSLYNVINVLDQGLATIGLGLSNKSKRSTGDLLKNLLLKRVLPVYMLTQIPGMINYFSEPLMTNKKEKDEGKIDNLGKTLMRDIVKPIDIGFHKFNDTLGFTNMFKYLQDTIAGSDQFSELPGIYQLGLSQTAEERKDYIENGYDPVRKNRYWSVSNTPFTGSKIDHWRPNIYRRIEADTKFSDTMYGSRQEYYNNTWYPNLVNPFAPLNYFLLDPNHYDKKHYYDRPYAMTAAKGENIPIIGPMVSGTVGQLYRHKMHKDYWHGNTLAPVNQEDEKPSYMLQTGIINSFDSKSKNDTIKAYTDMFYNTNIYNSLNEKSKTERSLANSRNIQNIINANYLMHHKNALKNYFAYNTAYANIQYNNQYNNAVYTQPNTNYSVAHNYNNPNQPYVVQQNQIPYSEAKMYPSPLQTSILPYRDYNRYDTALEAYVTPSGEVQIVDVPENLNLYDVNKELQHYSLNKIYGTNQRVNLEDYNNGIQEPENNKPVNYFQYSMGEMFNDLSDIYGLRGFMYQAMVFGEANVGKTKVDDSSYTYSINRSFWDQNLGGLGGELSEIARRFIHKKDNSITYLNPIRNTMPTWMPGSKYFVDFLHGDPYAKVMNGEERLPGEAYERLNNVHFDFSVTADMLSNTREQNVKHFLHQDEQTTYDSETARKTNKKTRTQFKRDILDDKYVLGNYNPFEEGLDRIISLFRNDKVNTPRGYDFRVSSAKDTFTSIFKGDDILLASNYKINDQVRGINGTVDAVIKDFHSRTGRSLINFRGVSEDEYNQLKQNGNIRNKDYYEMNYDLFMTNNRKSRGYIYYYNNDNPEEIYKARVKFNKKDLKQSFDNLYNSRKDISTGIATHQISRYDLYPLMDKYRILADVAPYSQEFKDVSAQISHANLTEKERKEASNIRKRMQEQKNPLRVYDYRFKTANLKSEKVTVKRIIDNNTILVNEYGFDHAIKFAGINVSESNTKLYRPSVKERKVKNKRTGRYITERTGKTMNEAARDEIQKYIKPGQKITIQYDADEFNKFGKDSGRSIKAVINKNGVNINRKLVSRGVAKEKEDDNSPAAMHVRYTKGDIAFGSMMETLMHGASHIPFIGDKFFHIRSPYEEYRKREVYNKDFKSWNHPIRDYLIPTIEETSSQNPIIAIVTGAFIGSLFGRKGNPYGKLVGSVIGASIPAIGATIHAIGSNKDREWVPKRRRQQDEINTYLDTLKYVKNMRLYKQYSALARRNDNFDVDKYLQEEENQGDENKKRKQELTDYKRVVKLDFKHRGRYNFKYGKPKYVTDDMDRKETITAINRELSEISSDRKVEKLPLNAIKAVSYKHAAEQTMYGYEPGDDVRNIMAALPKKERQYFSKLVNAPEEEKNKILRIAPSYLRRALESSWGLEVDEKPSLEAYFTKHALPGENWVGWREDSNLEDVKVKVINANGLDPGEYDIWTQNKVNADKVNIPVPKIHKKNNPSMVEARLRRLLENTGFDNINVSYSNSISGGNKTTMDIKEDQRDEISEQIQNMDLD